jgi:hypothetical protein
VVLELVALIAHAHGLLNAVVGVGEKACDPAFRKPTAPIRFVHQSVIREFVGLGILLPICQQDVVRTIAVDNDSVASIDDAAVPVQTVTDRERP